MLEPLGQSQVLRYLEHLSKDHSIYLISFEKPETFVDSDQEFQAMKSYLDSVNINWLPLRYHKKPSALATLYDIVQGIKQGYKLIKQHDIQIVHSRGYVAAVAALALKKKTHVKFLFDMRGFWADERVEGYLWPEDSKLYKIAKWFERKFLLNADVVVSLTQAAIDEMKTFPYLQNNQPEFVKITTCADLSVFKLPDSETVNKSRPFTLGYVGSVGTWYMFDEVLQCFKLLKQRKPEAIFYIFNRGDHDYIHERVKALNLDAESIFVTQADHQGVAQGMQNMDAGIFFYRPTYSKLATAPTRLGEFLGCGVPCLGNKQVGDMAPILEEEQVGVAVEAFDEDYLFSAVDRLLNLAQQPDIDKKCRKIAEKYFALENGVQAYDQLYKQLSLSYE